MIICEALASRYSLDWTIQNASLRAKPKSPRRLSHGRYRVKLLPTSNRRQNGELFHRISLGQRLKMRAPGRGLCASLKRAKEVKRSIKLRSRSTGCPGNCLGDLLIFRFDKARRAARFERPFPSQTYLGCVSESTLRQRLLWVVAPGTASSSPEQRLTVFHARCSYRNRTATSQRKPGHSSNYPD